MSECDTMFNERDRRWAAVQLIVSTDTSYDNRTIASTLKMQIRTVQRLRAQLNALDDSLEVVERTRLKSQHQSVPGCAEACVTAGLGAGPQVQRDPSLASEGVL